MKKTILIVMLLISHQAFAAWTMLDKTENGDAYSIDFSTMKNVNGNKRVWTLVNYLKPMKYAGKEIYSGTILREIDCNEQKYRFLSIFAYSEINAKGVVVETLGPEVDWRYSPPDSVGLGIVNAVCKK